MFVFGGLSHRRFFEKSLGRVTHSGVLLYGLRSRNPNGA